MNFFYNILYKNISEINNKKFLSITYADRKDI